MKEYFPEYIEKYMPEIEPYIENETVVMRFVGNKAESNTRLTGLFVVTDKNIYFRGKIAATAGMSRYTLIKSGMKSKEVHKIPLDSILSIQQKKNKFVIIEDLSWMGEKYAKKGKKLKIVIEIPKGKDESGKETKEELLKRCEEFNDYIRSKINVK